MRVVEVTLTQYLLLELIKGKEWTFENAISPGVRLCLKLDHIDLDKLEGKIRELRLKKMG